MRHPVLVALLPLAAAACAAAPRAAPRCQMTGLTQDWIQGSLRAWDDLRERALRLGPAPAPPIVFFDRYCVYSLSVSGTGPLALRAGRDTLRGEGRPHAGRIQMPNGLSVAATAEAFASLLPGDTATFLVMALEDVWRADPQHRGENENWSAYLRRAFVHEMTHARQLVTRAPMLRLAGGRVGLVDVDDDVIQQRFDTVRGFRESVRAEADLLYRAAATNNPEDRRTLARDALLQMRVRRQAAFGGQDTPWARLEQLLLDMEGAAQWSAFSLAGLYNRRIGPEARRELVRGSRQYWSQDLGLALYLALDALVPDWQGPIFSNDPPTSVELLERALRLPGEVP